MKLYISPPIPPLTEEEKKNPYARFYDVPIETPPDEVLEYFRPGNYMPQDKALRPEEAIRMATREGVPQPWGFCMLPGGYGYHTCRVDMPDVTEEMERWWSESHWIMQDDVHYKVWLPGFHFQHKDRVVENLGWGVGEVCFAYPLQLEMLPGYGEVELDPDLIGFFGCNGYFTPEATGIPMYNILLNAVKRMPGGGISIQTVGWNGVHLLDGKSKRMLPDGQVADIEKSRLFGCHNAWENGRKAQLLPELYALSQTL